MPIQVGEDSLSSWKFGEHTKEGIVIGFEDW